jgi:tRNA A37 threonylcarbamoyladenosine synthetase subunit TsaC/SUA5/YrdC
MFHPAEFHLGASRMLAKMSANNLKSLGKLCAELRVPYHVLAEAVAALRIAPALVLNGVRHFDAPAVQRLTAAVTAPIAVPPAHVAPRGVPSPKTANHATRAPGAPRSRPRRSRRPSGEASLQQPQGTQ